jgi:hypothetical protein
LAGAVPHPAAAVALVVPILPAVLAVAPSPDLAAAGAAPAVVVPILAVVVPSRAG